MRFRFTIPAVVAAILFGLWLFSRVAVLGDQTWLELTDTQSGVRIAAQALKDGEEVILTWRNSLFGLRVKEVFVARGGRLDLTQVTFEDPRGLPPALVRPEDLDDLYQTGGPFRAEGLSKPFTRIIFRVGEIGDPKLQIGRQVVQLAGHVGFGGAVLLVAKKPAFFSIPLRSIRSIMTLF